MSAINYIGTRPPLVEAFGEQTGQIAHVTTQVIDIVGVNAPSFDQIEERAASDAATVILSVRRHELTDRVGKLENRLLEHLRSAVVFRTAPLDRSLEMYWGWATATEVLLTAFHPVGTAWVHTEDLVEAVQRLDPATIREREGRAFDITGPERVPMERLCAEFSDSFDTKISLECETPESVSRSLLANGIPAEVGAWLVWYQAAVSDPRLPPTTPVLADILGHDPRFPRLVPEPTRPKES
ncbi:hypothetical protein [Auritidibacter ignavus]|uniref:hypothetical protein n=1 Tax=Auritidibacter ignavus TaxID=678932 RepID=UPI000D7345BB|nr:hypothetical protein [Auritidibacter ignavus]PXA79994.1 hypothetical protein DCC26_04655 [Auritidibacter sp. NML120779]WGH90317.1 hypothetical protein QDX23_09360 [Auritidibacter ignavus]